MTRPHWMTPKRILHPTDFTRGSETAFAHALKIAHAAEAHLDILHVDPVPEAVPWSDYPGVRATLTRWGVLRPGALKREVAEAGLYIRKIRAFGLGVVRPILRELRNHPADLIVLATHGREGIDRWLHQDISSKLSRESNVPSLFVPYGARGFVSLDDGNTHLDRILIPIDQVPDPQSAIDVAAMFARLMGSTEASFTLLHVGEDEDDTPAAELPEHEGWTWDRIVQPGDVVEQILATRREQSADLIVMSTQGHDGFLDAVRGSTTERILAGAQCPVLAVPA